MPTLKAKDLRTLSIDELADKAEGLRKERFQLRLQAKFGKLDDLSKLKQVRRDIAKILTVKQQMAAKQSSRTAAKQSSQMAAKQSSQTELQKNG